MSAKNTYQVGQSDVRPWGEWAVLEAKPNFCVKRISVHPGGTLSLQRHAHRAENWIVVSGEAEVTRNHETLTLVAPQSVYLACGDIHRVRNLGSEPLVFIEVQTGAILDENDIERLEDIYGRAPSNETTSILKAA